MDPDLPNAPGAGPVLVQLFRGVLYRDRHEFLWQSLLDFQAMVRDYVGVIGLELILDEAEGYAFLRQREPQEGNEDPLPRLVQRRALSYPLSLLLLLLRKRLVEQDAGGDEARVVLEQERLVEMLRVYLPDRGSEARTVDYIRTQINKAVDYGFLHRLKGERDSYEVRRIVKAAVSADWLADIDARLAAYREAANPDEP
ncbi:MAG: DUF4194 domain-containing protein [Pseudomonadota bacterium]|nr:DUF4194 domain-containing protein [Pseudomonadota bacterium]